MASKPEWTPENCRTLAGRRIEDWSSEELYWYVLEEMAGNYQDDQQEFEEDWETYFGEEDHAGQG